LFLSSKKFETIFYLKNLSLKTSCLDQSKFEQFQNHLNQFKLISIWMPFDLLPWFEAAPCTASARRSHVGVCWAPLSLLHVAPLYTGPPPPSFLWSPLRYKNIGRRLSPPFAASLFRTAPLCPSTLLLPHPCPNAICPSRRPPESSPSSEIARRHHRSPLAGEPSPQAVLLSVWWPS
jgi:hypothetical protein